LFFHHLEREQTFLFSTPIILNQGVKILQITLLRDIDRREHAILATIFEAQLADPEGICWGNLLENKQIEKLMSRQTFSHRLKGLLQRGLIEKNAIRNKRGKPTFYRLNSGLFTELREFRVRFYPWKVESDIQKFEKDIESFDTEKYIDATIELAFGRLIVLAIALTCFETEGARWMFYEATYQNIEQLLRYILERASRSKKDKEQALTQLFELLSPYSTRSIGKRFGLDEVYASKQIIIKKILKE
jgi:DNA-binding transcriptional ArsR family regulator